jgi:hypothetical protein
LSAAREAARQAVVATTELLQALDAGDFEGYVDGEPAQAEACRTILEWPLEEFDGETAALVNELVGLQRRLCEQFDRLLAASQVDGDHLGRGRRAVEAYGARAASVPLKTRAG